MDFKNEKSPKAHTLRAFEYLHSTGQGVWLFSLMKVGFELAVRNVRNRGATCFILHKMIV